MSQSTSPTVIVGAGFVGLFTALHLKQQNYSVETILIDRNDRFCFKPLLYEYLSGEMTSKEVVPLYGELLQGSDLYFLQDSVESIDLENHQIYLASGKVQTYGNLVLSIGSVPAYFAEGAAEHTFTFQSKQDIDRLKDHLLSQLRKATKTADQEARKQLLTVAIVGGGPVGVELALTIGDLLPQWYESMDGNLAELRIFLLNRGDILQGDVNSRLRDVATKAMEERRVSPELMLGASVTKVRADAVEFTREGEADALLAGTIVWACGIQVNPLIKSLSVPPEQRTQRGHLLVTPSLQLVGYPDVFAGGDCAVIDHGDPTASPLPPTAQVAYQQGAAIARALKAKLLANQELQPCQVFLRGTLMKLGIGTGVANMFNRYEISGPIGQKIRQITYLELLPTVVHNFQATLDWLKDDIFRTHTSEYHDYDYTAGYAIEELKTLATALTFSAAAVSVAEVGAISDRLESAALGRELAGASRKYATNRVIHALFGHQTKRELAMQHVKNIHQQQLKDLLTSATERINLALEILKEKANSDEVHEYKELLYGCCHRVAQAAGTGALGIGQRIDPVEADVLDKIKTALSLE